MRRLGAMILAIGLVVVFGGTGQAALVGVDIGTPTPAGSYPPFELPMRPCAAIRVVSARR